jgi:hypothetical protein
MKQVRQITDDFSSLSGNVKGYVRLKLELYRLMAIEGAVMLLSSLLISLVVLLLAIFLLFFLGLAFVYWYGEVVGPMYVGALIVVGFYLAASVLVFLYREKLFINPLVIKLTTIINEEGSDEEK